MKPWKPIHVLSLRPEYTPQARSPKGGRPCGLAGDIPWQSCRKPAADGSDPDRSRNEDDEKGRVEGPPGPVTRARSVQGHKAKVPEPGQGGG
jgi:hypothetical protein